MMVESAAVFAARDVAASIAYYRDILGFRVAFEYGEPTYYVGLCRDEVSLHVIAATETSRLPGNAAPCVFVDNVDELHEEFAARGARIPKPPQDYPYGMRDFDVIDPDGNQLTFGMESKRAP